MKLDDLKGKTVGFAASGGLDSCTVTKWLTEHGVNVVAICADMAQPDEANFAEVESRMRLSGGHRLCGDSTARHDRRLRHRSDSVSSQI